MSDQRRIDAAQSIGRSIAKDPLRAYRMLGNTLLVLFFAGVVVGVFLTGVIVAVIL